MNSFVDFVQLLTQPFRMTSEQREDPLYCPPMPRLAVILSGDVHYSFVNRATYESGGRRLQCLQLTSSGLRNSPDKGGVSGRLARHNRGEKQMQRGWRAFCEPPWWSKYFIFLLKNTRRFPFWLSAVELLPMRSDNDKRYITNIPNIALVYFDTQSHKPVRQVLLGGRAGRIRLQADF